MPSYNIQLSIYTEAPAGILCIYILAFDKLLFQPSLAVDNVRLRLLPGALGLSMQYAELVITLASDCIVLN